MTQAMEELRDALLALPLADRLDVIESVKETPGNPPDRPDASMDLHPLWIAELDRRSAAMGSGEEPGIPWEQVKEELDRLVDAE